MKKKKTSLAYRALRALVRACYPHMEVVGRENLPRGAAVIVGNHAQMHGPIACELFFTENRYTWCAGQMLHLKEVPAYAYQDFWSGKPARTRWFYRLLSYLIAPLSVLIFNNANTIPVYRDARLLTTFRTTLEKLRQGAHIVIFPEHNQPYNQIVSDFQNRFVDVARLYHSKTGEELCFVPLYIAPALKKMCLGRPVYANSAAAPEEERSRVCREVMEEITHMACALPRHRVVPYSNIPKKDYPYSVAQEVSDCEEAGG